LWEFILKKPAEPRILISKKGFLKLKALQKIGYMVHSTISIIFGYVISSGLQALNK